LQAEYGVAHASHSVFLSETAASRHHCEAFSQQFFCSRRISYMRPLKAIATFASVVVIACSMFAASWVGLALLGY
jgi:hypothetical protein